MLPAGTRPILEYVLDALIDAGCEELHVVVGYERERVQEYFGPTYRDVPIDYHVQDKQLGSGHALLQARAAVTGPTLVVNGDEIITAGMIREVLAHHRASEPVATLGVIESSRVTEYGAVRVDGHRVVEFAERPTGDDFRLLNAGVYVFEPPVLDTLETIPRPEGELSLTDAVIDLVEAGEAVDATVVEDVWTDATYPWDLLTVARDLLARGEVDGSERERGVWVADSAIVSDRATLRPPVVIGADAEIGPGAVVGPDTAVGTNVTVGANAVVARSVLDTDVRVGAGAVLLDCVTGQDVHCGVGTTVTGGPADVVVDATVHENRQLGALLADRVRVEGDVSFAPGSLVGPGAVIRTGATVDGEVPAGAEVVR